MSKKKLTPLSKQSTPVWEALYRHILKEQKRTASTHDELGLRADLEIIERRLLNNRRSTAPPNPILGNLE